MESDIHTLQEFYTHTKANLYIIIIISLICMVGFWNFLAGKDEAGPEDNGIKDQNVKE